MAEMNGFEKFFVNNFISDWFNKKWGVKSLLEWIQVTKASRILELGCGKGTTTFCIAQKFPDASIIALDYDAKQIELARKSYYLSKVNFVVGDAEKLTYKDNSFDLIIEILSLHHMENWQKAIQEIYRVLKPKGYFLLKDMHTSFHGKISMKKYITEMEKEGFIVLRTKGKRYFMVEAVKK